ncbi:hypothetical protein ACOMHN_042865 [Nucella lapillus]
MASPDPGRYPHHHLYSHPDHQSLAPLPPPPPHHASQEVYGDGPYHPHHHYPDHQTPYHPPPPPPQPEPEQPLDLSVYRSPRPTRAGPPTVGEGGAAKRPRLEEDVRENVDSARGGHSNVCLIRGCNCHSPQPVHHHTPHYSRHRHSPYPQYPAPGTHSPSLGEGPPYPHPYAMPQPSSSPGVMYGGRDGNDGTSPYMQHDSHSRSPGMALGYGADLLPNRPSPGALLCPPPHPSSVSPLSISTQGRGPSPCPAPRESLAALRDVSPRPFYRPFEDGPGGPQAALVLPGTHDLSSAEPYPSEDDLSASSTLLMLSNTTSKRPRHSADSSADDFRPREQHPGLTENAHPEAGHSHRHGVFHHPPPPPRSSLSPRVIHAVVDSKPSSRDGQKFQKENQPVTQDGTVASTYSSSDDLNDSPSQGQEERKTASLQSRLVRVVGTTPLATLREERAKKQAVKRTRMKELLAHRPDHCSASSNDSEASDQHSSGQASPRSSDGSNNDVGQGFPIPPDPNLKMSALDYLISKVLVERIDVPFKACNSEIQQIYTGAKKGRLTLVDLIELQVEASLKA